MAKAWAKVNTKAMGNKLKANVQIRIKPEVNRKGTSARAPAQP